jgi:hypothetical protein
MAKAHRISWELTHGPIPEGEGFHGICVLHVCDVRSCVNPAHLFLGTNADNSADKIRKGRARWVAPKGSENGKALLTEADILDIRRQRKAGVRGKDLASRYGVAQQTICSIVKGRNWKHVSEEQSS